MGAECLALCYFRSVKRIAIIGPESTGKSALARGLSDYFGDPWVPEYAREYLQHLGRVYEMDDLLRIAKGQLYREDELATEAGRFLVCDTNLIVIKIWSDFKYGSTHPWVEEQLINRFYDHYLLTDIDLPWEPDPLREHPDQRRNLFDNYLEDQDLRYTMITGLGKSRLELAIRALNNL